MGNAATTSLKVNNLGKVTILAVSQLPYTGKGINFADKDNYMRPFKVNAEQGTLDAELLAFDIYALKINYLVALSEGSVVRSVEIVVNSQTRALLLETTFHLE